MSLTAVAARNAKPREKPYKLAAGLGLYLEVMPTGARYWRMKYRIAGKEKRLALGVFPEVSLADARTAADDARALLRDGVDPSAKRKADNLARHLAASNSFEAIAREWIERRTGKGGKEVATVTHAKNKWLLETYAIPALGARPIGEITARELLTVLRKAESTGKLETAQRLKIKISQVFRYAIITSRAENDPTLALRGALKAPEAKHHASPKDPVQIGELLRAIEGYSGQPVTAAALKLAPLVFVRPGELRGARWDELNLDGAEWRIPAARMKMRAPHIVPLSKQAVKILRELHKLTGTRPLVFPSVRTADRPMSENTVNAALRRLGYATDEATGHGFRSMASTRLNEMGWAPDVIERQLAHTESNGVRAAYNHAEYLPDRRKMMQAWANYLDGLKSGADVVAFKRKA